MEWANQEARDAAEINERLVGFRVDEYRDGDFIGVDSSGRTLTISLGKCDVCAGDWREILMLSDVPGWVSESLETTQPSFRVAADGTLTGHSPTVQIICASQPEYEAWTIYEGAGSATDIRTWAVAVAGGGVAVMHYL